MTYYIEYKENKQKTIFKKILNKINYNFSIVDIDMGKRCIYINKKYINRYVHKKINKYLSNHNLEGLSDNTLIANDVIVKDNNKISKIKYNPEGKYLLKVMLYDVIRYLEKIIDTDFRNEDIYIAVINDKQKNIIMHISELFRSTNIITTRVGHMRRMEKSILKSNDTIISISNNRKKSLRRAKILINFDFNNDLMMEYDINRNCIIINLNNCTMHLKKSFQGCIIDSIQIDYKNRYKNHINKDKFDNLDLYSSYIQGLNYFEVRKHIKNDNCNIVKLIGTNGFISNSEIMNNFTNSVIKLDKTRKMD